MLQVRLQNNNYYRKYFKHMKKLQYIQPQVDVMNAIMPTAIYCASTGEGGNASDILPPVVSEDNPLIVG